MKIVTTNYKNMPLCLYEVAKVVLEVNKHISLDLTCMGTRLDNLEVVTV